MREQRRLAAIVSADVAGYSRLMGRDESGTLAMLKELRREVLDPRIDADGGRIVKTTGDGLLLEFPSVVDAVRCVVEVQTAMAARGADMPDDRRIAFRIGINLGDIIIDGDDIFGDGVNIAARLQEIAAPGGVCISSRVHDDVRDRLDTAFADGGAQALKNIARPVQVWRWSPGAVATSTWAVSETPTPVPLALPDKPSIAVLPFSNMSGDPEQEYFADGIAEDVLTELSKLHWLFVIARNSSFTYKGGAVDVKQVGRDLGVRYVLEGSVRKAKNRVRVTGQLIDATTGRHVWADRYDRDLSDIFTVQDEITEAVTAAIGPAIVDAERQRAVRKPPENLGAWEAYQRGMWHMSKQERGEMELARTFFRRATELDPGFGAAYSGLAWTHLMAASIFGADLAEASELAEPLTRKALSLDENDADAHARLALAIMCKGDVEGAVHEADQALSLNPNCAEALGVKGASLIYAGHREEGREVLRRYLLVSPRDPGRPIRLAQFAASQYHDGDYEGAVKTAREALRQHPNNFLCHRWLAASLARLGRESEAKEALETLLKMAPWLVPAPFKGRAPYRSIADHEDMLAGLRKAGWRG